QVVLGELVEAGNREIEELARQQVECRQEHHEDQAHPGDEHEYPLEEREHAVQDLHRLSPFLASTRVDGQAPQPFDRLRLLTAWPGRATLGFRYPKSS